MHFLGSFWSQKEWDKNEIGILRLFINLRVFPYFNLPRKLEFVKWVSWPLITRSSQAIGVNTWLLGLIKGWYQRVIATCYVNRRREMSKHFYSFFLSMKMQLIQIAEYLTVPVPKESRSLVIFMIPVLVSSHDDKLISFLLHDILPHKIFQAKITK